MNYQSKRQQTADIHDVLVAHLTQDVGVEVREATARHWLHAAALTVRADLIQRWHETNNIARARGLKQVAYLSMEFLMARDLKNALSALRMEGALSEALGRHGVTLDDLYAEEVDPALGNGGLGRLAACFLDSMANIGLPGVGYGIRYEYGMFRQELRDGNQIELPDDWLGEANPWEFPRSERTYLIRFGGRVEHRDGRAHWVDTDDIKAVAFDRLVPGYDSRTVNTLRLWSPKAIGGIDLLAFNRGAFIEALAPRVRARTVGRVLYPDDSTAEGRELRLRQQYFFVSASVQDVLARFLSETRDFDLLPDRVAIHLNDTHPAIAPIELMRILVDEHRVDWERAWNLSRRVCAYTNHTLMPEALETWPWDLMWRLLPRHLEIIEEVDRRLHEDLSARNDWSESVFERVRLVEGERGRQVNMGRLSVLACHRVNGVSKLHSRLVRESLFVDFARLFPGRFDSVTNGITHRRWIMQANPELSALLDESIGSGWRQNLDSIRRLDQFATDAAFGDKLRSVKLLHKQVLARLIEQKTGVVVDPNAMFDVHIKRIHEYKRQLLNILGVIARWNAIRREPNKDWAPRVVIFAGKAASAYWLAKRIIKLAHDVGVHINHDPRIADRLKLVFLPNYNVSLAETIIPAADLSQQISLAGTEASGTGNMKLALNGALTIGTADGANIEMAEAVGVDNMFLFGLSVNEVRDVKAKGYISADIVAGDPRLQEIMKQLSGDEFSPGEPGRHQPIVDSLVRDGDRYLALQDFAAYLEAQAEVDRLWSDERAWTDRVVRNIAGMGRFSSDRAIREYADRIWHTTALI
jgi:starch phosphorylase